MNAQWRTSVIDYGGGAYVCGGEHLRVLRYPHALRRIIEFIRGKGGAELQNEVLYIGKRFPRVPLPLEKLRRAGLCKIQKFLYTVHISLT